MTVHSPIGASSMYRWSVCPGSVRLSEGIESRSSSYAEEGTDAHALAAQCLRENKNAGEFEGSEFKRDGRSFLVTEDMASAVQVYLDYVRALVNPENGDVLYIEHRFDLSNVYPGLFGTADAVIWQPRTRTLVVIDYKHGAGVPVEVKANPQLFYYGLGALMNLGLPARNVQITVVQPRVDHPDGTIRTQLIPADDMLDFTVDLIGYAKATEDPNAPLVPGDHCRFCPANTVGKDGEPVCPKVGDFRTELAKAEFSAGVPYDPAKLKLALDSLPVLEAFIKNVREFAYAEAEAGKEIPGYKLVAKRATRKWRSEGEVVEYCQMMDLDSEKIFAPRKLRSPAQIEKVLGKGVLDQFVIKESSGHTLVPESDKRPPVRVDPRSEFADD